MKNKTEGVKQNTKIIECVCKSTFQDERYGKNMRVCNPTTSKEAGKQYRCTVCGRDH